MKQLLFLFFAICITAGSNAQFLYKLERAPLTIPLTKLNVTNVGTINPVSPAVAGFMAALSSATITINSTIDLPEKTRAESSKNLGLGQTFILGTGGSQTISVVEILSGHLAKNKKDRLSFGGAVANAESKEETDVKTLIQGGGNFFLSYSYPIWILPNKPKDNFIALIARTKLGAILPKAGSSTNVIQASFDPGIELLFSLTTDNGDIGIAATFRSSVLWASKDFSDATGFTKNLIPYHFITGGITLKSLGAIVYSQSFLSKDVIGFPQPKGSLGFSFTL